MIIKPENVDRPLALTVISCAFHRSAPPKSSHLSYLLRPLLDWASITQRLMRALFVVPPQSVQNDPPRLLKRLEGVLPHRFLFETSERTVQ